MKGKRQFFCRASSACEFCKIRKIKCEPSASGTCTACSDRSRTCLRSNSNRSRESSSTKSTLDNIESSFFTTLPFSPTSIHPFFPQRNNDRGFSRNSNRQSQHFDQMRLLTLEMESLELRIINLTQHRDALQAELLEYKYPLTSDTISMYAALDVYGTNNYITPIPTHDLTSRKQVYDEFSGSHFSASSYQESYEHTDESDVEYNYTAEEILEALGV